MGRQQAKTVRQSPGMGVRAGTACWEVGDAGLQGTVSTCWLVCKWPQAFLSVVLSCLLPPSHRNQELAALLLFASVFVVSLSLVQSKSRVCGAGGKVPSVFQA